MRLTLDTDKAISLMTKLKHIMGSNLAKELDFNELRAIYTSQNQVLNKEQLKKLLM